MSASGGTAVPVTAFDESRGERSHRFPQFLPDGKRFIFSVMAAIETPDTDGGLSIFAASLDSTEKTSIVATRSSARYASSGHLLFLRDRVLVAQAFDPGTLELSGDAVPVAENMSPSGRRQTMVSVSETGRLLFQPGFPAEEQRLIWLDREGQELGTVGRPAVYYGPVLSHDQTRIAVEIWDREAQQSDLFVLDEEGGTRTRLTFNPAIDRLPRWSADDKTLYFSSDRAGQRAVYSKSSSGAGTSALVYGGEGSVQLSSLSLDGKTAWITSGSLTGPTDRDILRVDLESREAEVILKTPSREQWAAISPDGRWLLHQSDGQVVVQSLMGDGGKWQISTDFGALARWTRGGKEIVFCDREGTLMAAAVTLEPAFSAGTPEVLFDPGEVGFNQWDVTPDGNRFLVAQRIEQFEAEPLTLVQNWTNELER